METLNYIGKATKQNHGADGLRYRNRWATGAQDLIFPSEKHAEAFARARNATVQHKRGGK